MRCVREETKAPRNAASASRRCVGIAARSTERSSAPGSENLLPSTHSKSSASFRDRASRRVAAAKSTSGSTPYEMSSETETSPTSPSETERTSSLLGLLVFPRRRRLVSRHANVRAAALATRLETRLGSSGSRRPSARAERSTATTALATALVSRASWIRANRGTTLAPSCLRNAGRAYVPTPARCLPALRSASASGPTHHARHEANAAGEPTAATVFSSLPARRSLHFSAFLAPGRAISVSVSVSFAAASSSSVVVSKRSDCETAVTSAPAAVHTESSFIARNVFASRSGARLSSRFAPSRRATAAKGTYLPFCDASFLSRLFAASSRNASGTFPVIPPRASSMSSSVSKLRCVSLTVCDKGSSQLAQRMAQTRSRNGAGNASSKEKDKSSSNPPSRSRRRLAPDAASALTRTSAARSAAAAWYLWCESSGRSRDEQMYGSK
mmetsp:Transcript_11532/g.48363  ORF Transcript_11532/g.48363 Transcript_11532/m.48363 type:complete len:443 (+) Transcript_11532:1149-2477(+)